MTAVNRIDTILRNTTPRLTVTSLTVGATSGGGSFLKAKNASTLSPANIVLQASITGLTTPTYQWYYANSNAPSTWISISGATGSSYTIVNSTFYNPTTNTGHLMTGALKGTQVVYKCVATQAGWASAESTMIVTYSQQANDVPVATLSKTSLSLPTTALDVVDYTTSNCSIVVSIGGTNIPYAASGANTYSVAVSPNNITAGTASTTTVNVTNDTRSFGVMSGMSAGQVTATITYTVTARDIDGVATTIKLIQTITKATAGVVATTYNISTSAEIITKAAPDAATSGVYSSTTIQGKQVASTVSNYGWVTVTANGDTEALTATNTAVTPVTLSPTTTAGKSSYTIKLYNQATVSGATLLATKVLSVVFAGSPGSPGSAGDTAVFAYRVIAGAALPTAPTIGSNTVPTLGVAVTDDGLWHVLPKPTLATNDWQFQVSGTKTAAGAYTWQTQGYLSTFKVGRLSALSAQMGQVELDSAGAVYSTGTTYASGSGIFLGYDSTKYKFKISNGTITGSLHWDGDRLFISSTTAYGRYQIGGGSTILTVDRVLPMSTGVPLVYLRDNQTFGIASTNSTSDTITLSSQYDTSFLSTSPRTQVKFDFTAGGIVAGTLYYVKSISANGKDFTISNSSTLNTTVNITSNLSNPGTVTIQASLTTQLMYVQGNNTGAAIDIVNVNSSGSAAGFYSGVSGSYQSEVTIAGIHAIYLGRGGIRFTNQSLVTEPRTLDDYNESTWTPTKIATGITTITHDTSNTGYTKIGRAITFNITLKFTNTGTSGSIKFTLPTTATISASFAVFITGPVSGTYGQLVAWSTAGNNIVEIDYLDSTTGSLAGNLATKVSNNTDLRVSGTYW